MVSTIEAEMARFEEEISSANDGGNDDFKPPPPPPVMPPLFLPHALQSSKGNNDSTSDQPTKNESDSQSTEKNDSNNKNEKDINTGSGRTVREPIGFGNSGPGPVSRGFGPMGPPRPLGPPPMGPTPLPPGMMGSRMPIGPMGPGPMLPGPMPPPGMMGPNAPHPLGPPGMMGMNRPNLDPNMMGPMPPPMPTFFPPPAMPDFSGILEKQQQTVYSAAPVLKKKAEAKETTGSSKKAKTSAEKDAREKRVSETSATVSKSDDRLSEVGPEAGPHVGGVQAGPQVPVMMPPSAYGQPALYDLSPLAGNPEMAKAAAQATKKKKIIRTAAGQKWEDQSLLDWDNNDYRIFCGDLGNEVTDDTLARVFSRYSSFQKARVVRDKNSKKTKGYGFVSFKDPNDFIRAMREINGKYVGNRPIKLRKSNWKDRNIDIVRKKVKEKKKLGYKV